MQCSKCRHDNEPRDLFCRKCGAKLHYTQGEVRKEFQQRALTKARQETEEQTRYYLVLTAFIFFVLLWIKVAFSTLPRLYILPSVTNLELYSPFSRSSLQSERLSLAPGALSPPVPKQEHGSGDKGR